TQWETYCMNKSRTSPVVIDKRERAVQALELRKAGISYELIAQRLNYSNRTAAYRAVSRLLSATEKEASNDLREVELRRLDDLFLSVYQKARNNADPLQLQAVDRCLRIMERRAKIAGIDAPEKTQTDVRQVIKVVYEDVQYADDFDDEPSQAQQMQHAGLLAMGANSEGNDEEWEEYEDDGEEWGDDEVAQNDSDLSPIDSTVSVNHTK
ncbi:MAG: hypothetical protein ACK5XN_04670, partial [Bacteroidota bacterium]